MFILVIDPSILRIRCLPAQGIQFSIGSKRASIKLLPSDVCTDNDFLIISQVNILSVSMTTLGLSLYFMIILYYLIYLVKSDACSLLNNKDIMDKL